METLELWYSGLAGAERFFWTVALLASAVFLIQALLTLVGMDADTDFDMSDMHADTMDNGGALSLFSIRSLINFLVGFGWAGVTFLGCGLHISLVVCLSGVVGVAFAYMYLFMRRQLKKLERNGAYKISDCVGMSGQVYLRIPAKGTGKGKVQISVNVSVVEVNAVTDGEAIPTGTTVRVAAICGTDLKVERQN